jgi:hypothetical protein
MARLRGAYEPPVKAIWLFLLGSTLAGCASSPATAAAPRKREVPSYPRHPGTIAMEDALTRLYGGDVAEVRVDAVPMSTGSPVVPPARREEPSVDPLDVAQEAPPRYKKVFEGRRQFHFVVVDDVDPHGEDGGRIRTRSNVTCTVGEHRDLEGILGAQLFCVRPGTEEEPAEFPFAFVSAPGGVWMTGSLPATQAMAGDIIHEPPVFAEFPKARRRAYERPGMFEDQVDRCVQRVEVAGESTCFEESCDVAQGYGDTKLRVCLSSRGIESIHRENLDGPRITKWQLQRTELPPEPESDCHG